MWRITLEFVLFISSWNNFLFCYIVVCCCTTATHWAIKQCDKMPKLLTGSPTRLYSKQNGGQQLKRKGREERAVVLLQEGENFKVFFYRMELQRAQSLQWVEPICICFIVRHEVKQEGGESGSHGSLPSFTDSLWFSLIIDFQSGQSLINTEKENSRCECITYGLSLTSIIFTSSRFTPPANACSLTAAHPSLSQPPPPTPHLFFLLSACDATLLPCRCHSA